MSPAPSLQRRDHPSCDKRLSAQPGRIRDVHDVGADGLSAGHSRFHRAPEAAACGLASMGVSGLVDSQDDGEDQGQEE
jgi:hypothetical protein